MSIINDSHAIGVDTRNLILKTRGSLHVKVGDRYYEIDFRNLNAKPESQEKEEYIISVDSEKQIEELEYPGDNKLIIGLDGSLFVTKNKSIINITPKSQVVIQETPSENITIQERSIRNLQTVHIGDRLYGDGSTIIDFVNGEITTDVLNVTKEINVPNTTVKNKCCKTFKDFDDEGDEFIQTKYLDSDFIEIVEIPEKLVVKSGVIIKSSATLTIPVFIGNEVDSESVTFENGGLYIIYNNNGEFVQTKLN